MTEEARDLRLGLVKEIVRESEMAGTPRLVSELETELVFELERLYSQTLSQMILRH
jgi:hypothetical protein